MNEMAAATWRPEVVREGGRRCFTGAKHRGAGRLRTMDLMVVLKGLLAFCVIRLFSTCAPRTTGLSCAKAELTR